MTNKVKTIEVDGRHVEIHDIYHTAKLIINEKIVFTDIPLSVNENEIIGFLNNQSGIVVIAACFCDNNNKLTPFYRAMFVKGPFSPPLHNTGLIDSIISVEFATVTAEGNTDHVTRYIEKCCAYADEENIISI